MSHYSVAIFTKRGRSEIDTLLEPYNENNEVPHYISKTELINAGRAAFERQRDGDYAAYVNNPEEFVKNHTQTYVDFITKEFPNRFQWNDEDFYSHELKHWDSDAVQPDGSVLSTYNPNSKWDWWYFRDWEDGFPIDGDRVKNIDPDLLSGIVTYAVVTPDGVWHAPGEIGWFGSSSETQEEWDEWATHYRERFIDSADPNWYMFLLDCHI